jgi:hypothetical protein
MVASGDDTGAAMVASGDEIGAAIVASAGGPAKFP